MRQRTKRGSKRRAKKRQVASDFRKPASPSRAALSAALDFFGLSLQIRAVKTRYPNEPTDWARSQKRTGVLLTNLGTPDAPTPEAVRRYLAQFLWDPRVVELPRPLWWLVLHGIVLRTRPKKSAEAYQKIWTERGSPILEISKRQLTKLKQAVNSQLQGQSQDEFPFALGMTYGQPSIAEGLNMLRSHGCNRIMMLPLFPQQSGATTGATQDALFRELKGWRHTPELHLIQGYHDDCGYIQALANSIQTFWQDQGPSERLLISFHGMPIRYIEAGDSYASQCKTTATLLAKTLDLAADQWQLSFQSRFGREPWLQPYTDGVLAQWGAQGVKSVDVICPGFAADCLETLEEIAIRGKEQFLGASDPQGDNTSFRYIPALNDRTDHISALAALIERRFGCWHQTKALPDRPVRTNGDGRGKNRALSPT